MRPWLALGLAAATLSIGGIFLVTVLRRLVLRLAPPQGIGALPSPPSPPDFDLLRWLPVAKMAVTWSFVIGGVLALLGEDLTYTGALERWAKAFGPAGIVAITQGTVNTYREGRPAMAATLRNERYEAPPMKQSTRRAVGALYLAAVIGGIFWAQLSDLPPNPVLD